MKQNVTNLLRKHWHYSFPLVPISCGGVVDDDVTNIDVDGYRHPSVELVAIGREEQSWII